MSHRDQLGHSQGRPSAGAAAEMEMQQLRIQQMEAYAAQHDPRYAQRVQSFEDGPAHRLSVPGRQRSYTASSVDSYGSQQYSPHAVPPAYSPSTTHNFAPSNPRTPHSGALLNGSPSMSYASPLQPSYTPMGQGTPHAAHQMPVRRIGSGVLRQRSGSFADPSQSLLAARSLSSGNTYGSPQQQNPFAAHPNEPREPAKPSLFAWQIRRGTLKAIRILGAGQYGEVYLAKVTDPQTNLSSDCAVKLLKEGATREDKLDFLAEAEAMVDLQHENLVRLRGVAIQQRPWLSVLELCEYGDLAGYLRKCTRYKALLNFREQRQLCVQIAAGMAYMEANQYIHMDLAARNVMLARGTVAKVGDFGLARKLKPNTDHYRLDKAQRLPIAWMAIESLTLKIFSCKSDVWGFGVVLWELFSYADTPYKGIPLENIQTNVEQGLRLQPPRGMPQLFYEMVVESCWSLKSENRPSFAQLSEYIGNFPEMDESAGSNKSDQIREFGAIIEAAKDKLGLGTSPRPSPNILRRQSTTSGTVSIQRANSILGSNRQASQLSIPLTPGNETTSINSQVARTISNLGANGTPQATPTPVMKGEGGEYGSPHRAPSLSLLSQAPAQGKLESIDSVSQRSSMHSDGFGFPATPTEEGSPVAASPLPEAQECSFSNDDIGYRVSVKGKISQGILRFIGKLEGDKNICVGVELDTAEGDNDGSINGVRYFTCNAKCGTFCEPSMVEKETYGETYEVDTGSTTDAHLDFNGFTPKNIGDAVDVDGYGEGIIRYIGLHVHEGTERIGVELDTPIGKNNGTVRGYTYFKTKEKHGLLCDPRKVHRMGFSPNDLNTPDVLDLATSDDFGDFSTNDIGSAVQVENLGRGVLRFLGTHHHLSQPVLGIELDLPNGDMDGNLDGRFYFKCRSSYHGILASPDIVRRVTDSPRKVRPSEPQGALASLKSQDVPKSDSVVSASSPPLPVRNEAKIPAKGEIIYSSGNDHAVQSSPSSSDIYAMPKKPPASGKQMNCGSGDKNNVYSSEASTGIYEEPMVDQVQVQNKSSNKRSPSLPPRNGDNMKDPRSGKYEFKNKVGRASNSSAVVEPSNSPHGPGVRLEEHFDSKSAAASAPSLGILYTEEKEEKKKKKSRAIRVLHKTKKMFKKKKERASVEDVSANRASTQSNPPDSVSDAGLTMPEHHKPHASRVSIANNFSAQTGPVKLRENQPNSISSVDKSVETPDTDLNDQNILSRSSRSGPSASTIGNPSKAPHIRAAIKFSEGESVEFNECTDLLHKSVYTTASPEAHNTTHTAHTAIVDTVVDTVAERAGSPLLNPSTTGQDTSSTGEDTSTTGNEVQSTNTAHTAIVDTIVDIVAERAGPPPLNPSTTGNDTLSSEHEALHQKESTDFKSKVPALSSQQKKKNHELKPPDAIPQQNKQVVLYPVLSNPVTMEGNNDNDDEDDGYIAVVGTQQQPPNKVLPSAPSVQPITGRRNSPKVDQKVGGLPKQLPTPPARRHRIVPKPPNAQRQLPQIVKLRNRVIVGTKSNVDVEAPAPLSEQPNVVLGGDDLGSESVVDPPIRFAAAPTESDSEDSSEDESDDDETSTPVVVAGGNYLDEPATVVNASSVKPPVGMVSESPSFAPPAPPDSDDSTSDESESEV